MALRLRKITECDLEMIMNWRMLPEVTRYMYTDPTLTLDGQKKWFRKIMASEDEIYWIIQIDGVDIGLIDIIEIDYKNERCEWAYYIADTSFRGRGIATQLECNIYDFVFNKLKLNKICCEVFCFNEKVISIHKKFGCEIEGTRKEHICKNNQYYDIVEMGISKEKWDSVKHNYQYEKIEINEYFFERKLLEKGSSYYVGQNGSFSKTITETDIAMFAGFSGDFNSLHMNEREAVKSRFGKRVCHGMLIASFISTVLGNYFPGKGTIYLSQNLKFEKPAFIGDTITANVVVEQILKKDILLLETQVFNQNMERLISGTATVKIPRDNKSPQ